MKRVLASLIGLYLLAAVVTRLAEAMGGRDVGARPTAGARSPD